MSKAREAYKAAHAAIDAAVSARAHAAIATALRGPNENEAHAKAVRLLDDAHAALDLAVEEARREGLAGHRCTLPDSISEALNSGDGSYRP